MVLGLFNPIFNDKKIQSNLCNLNHSVRSEVYTNYFIDNDNLGKKKEEKNPDHCDMQRKPPGFRTSLQEEEGEKPSESISSKIYQHHSFPPSSSDLGGLDLTDKVLRG